MYPATAGYESFMSMGSVEFDAGLTIVLDEQRTERIGEKSGARE